MKISNETKQRIVDLSDQGFSNCEVARRIGCSEKSVRRVLLQHAESSANVTSSNTCANPVAPDLSQRRFCFQKAWEGWDSGRPVSEESGSTYLLIMGEENTG
jgi:hypothetical protein